GRVGATGERGQAGCQPLEWTAAFFFIAHNLDGRGQWRNILARGGDDDDGLDSLIQQANDTRQHDLAGKRQPGLRPAHALALPAAQDDSAHSYHDRASTSLAAVRRTARDV